jgi:multidrug efflux pump subunit AcrB
MKITEMALRASRLTYLAAVIILVAGIATFLNFPSQEEPSVTIRDAVVAVLNPGMPAERVEQLIARPIEERLPMLSLCFHRVRWGHLSTTTSAVLPWPPLR